LKQAENTKGKKLRKKEGGDLVNWAANRFTATKFLKKVDR